MNTTYSFFKLLCGLESWILEFDWLITLGSFSHPLASVWFTSSHVSYVNLKKTAAATTTTKTQIRKMEATFVFALEYTLPFEFFSRSKTKTALVGPYREKVCLGLETVLGQHTWDCIIWLCHVISHNYNCIPVVRWWVNVITCSYSTFIVLFTPVESLSSLTEKGK